MLRLGQVVARTGLSRKQIRDYERRGLLTGVGRTSGEQRSYDDTHIERLTLIRKMREAEMPIADIKLTLQVLERRFLGVEAKGLRRVRQICRMARTQMEIADLLMDAIEEGGGGK